jgi:hypothetical protein
MNLIELNRALRQLRLGGIAAVLETRLQQAQAVPMAHIIGQVLSGEFVAVGSSQPELFVHSSCTVANFHRRWKCSSVGQNVCLLRKQANLHHLRL